MGSITKKVILDVDTGSDDAIAIMAAIQSPFIDVQAICNVWGNLSVENTTANSLAVVTAMETRIPVYKGCSRPMVKDRSSYRDLVNEYQPLIVDGVELKIHYDKLEGLPEPGFSAESKHAVRFYYDYLSASEEKVTIIAVGPLTNLGFLLLIAPELATKIDRLIIMGGGVDLSNCSASAEANIWHDPEAFQIILNSGVKPLLVPIDATHRAALSLEDAETLESLGTFAGTFAASLIRQRVEYEMAYFGPERNWSAIHDALAVCAFINPEVLQDVRAVHCAVGFSGKSDGEILIDRRLNPADTNAEIALSADKDLFLSILCDLFRDKEAKYNG